jgi:hypothetical protein
MRTFNPQRLLRVGIVSASLLGAPAFADTGDTIVWQSVVGIVQANNVVGTGSGAVTGGGQPWTTLGGRAFVDLATGQASFQVRGLVFAGGNTIGTPLPITRVKGTLVCDTDGSASPDPAHKNSVLVDTLDVALDAQGDAQWSGSVGTLPAECLTQPDVAFLIRIVPANRWIANGAVTR